MKVRLEIGAWLREAYGDKGPGLLLLDKELPDGATIGDLLRSAAAGRKDFNEVIFDRSGDLNSVIIAVNGQLIPSSRAISARLNDGDKVTILPFIDGG